MPGCDLTRYKVVHNDRVLRALLLMEVRFPQNEWPSPDRPLLKPEYLTLLVVNTDGVLEAITGKAEEFQFIPILNVQ